MEIAQRIQKLLVVSVEQFSTRLWDVGISQVLANNRAILGLHQAIIIALPGSGFGEADQHLVQQLGYYMVYELRPIIGMKPSDNKREIRLTWFPLPAPGRLLISFPQRLLFPTE